MKYDCNLGIKYKMHVTANRSDNRQDKTDGYFNFITTFFTWVRSIKLLIIYSFICFFYSNLIVLFYKFLIFKSKSDSDSYKKYYNLEFHHLKY